MKYHLVISKFNEPFEDGEVMGEVRERNAPHRTVAFVIFHPLGFHRYEVRTPTGNFPNDLKGDDLIGFANFEKDVLKIVEIYYKER